MHSSLFKGAKLIHLRVLVYLLYYKAKESRKLYSARLTLATYLRTLKLKGSL
jgi:hypothetical protein